MKRSSALGLRYGNLPVCIDVNFTRLVPDPLFMQNILEFSIEQGVI